MLKSVIRQHLPSKYPGLSATELHDRLREEQHELLKDQSNSKSLQSAIYNALNEMMFVYVDKRRLKGARNHHEYIALQPTQESRTEAKERSNSRESPAHAENTLPRSQCSSSLEPQVPKSSTVGRSVVIQTTPKRSAAAQSASEVQTTQSARACQDGKDQGNDITYASAEKARPQGSIEGTQSDVVQTQSRRSAVTLSSNKESDDKPQPSTPAVAAAPSTNTRTHIETTTSVRDHTGFDNCPTATPSGALVVRTPTVPLSRNDSSQKMTKSLVTSRSIQGQGEQGGAGPQASQQASDRNTLAVKFSQATEISCPGVNKTSEECEARTHRQHASSVRETASPHPHGVTTKGDKTAKEGKQVDQGRTTQFSHHVDTDDSGNIKNAALIELGKRVERAHLFKSQCETFERSKMTLEARSKASEAELAESVNRANGDIARFNLLNMRQQKLQAQLSESEQELADARRQTTLSREAARRKDAEYQNHAALMAQLVEDHASAEGNYHNELRSLGFG